MNTAPVVRVDALLKRYRRREAVRGVSLQVARGELYGVIGPDGAGKSSLFKAVAGVLAFEGGRVQVFGRPVGSEREAEQVQPRIGFMPQGLGQHLYPELSVDENVDFFADLRGVRAETRVARKSRLLAMTRLDAFRTRPMKALSGGMKQKLGLVCTLIHEPELIVLDEPTTGVDPLSRRDFWRLLGELVRERGMTALVSTAYLDEASRFDRVALMHDGRLILEGDPDTLAKARPSGSAPSATPELEDVVVESLRALEHEPAPALRLPDDAPAAPPAPGHAIEAVGLGRDFGDFRAVSDVSFRAAAGEIFGLLGANGAGKTTVIKMLTGILPPTRGSGHVAGADMRRASREIRQRIGYMSQSFSLYGDLGVRDNVMLYAGIYGLSGLAARRRADWVIELAGLQAHREDSADSLPMGLRQRLALGCALMHRPRVLFLDEPTSGVDPLARRHFWSILTWLAREHGVAILLSTHHMAEAELCDHLVLMFDGRVAADASPQQMKRELQQQAGQLLEVHCAVPAAGVLALREAGYRDAVLHGHAARLMTRDPATDERRIAELFAAQGLALLSLQRRPVDMEEVFVQRVAALQGAAR
ncbi:MAG: ABC transporter ATP-binding protein [Burkholderiaceae bacterium]|nr:ABC transporter ATP-binding protein [Burkholderiaceae bacterium]